MPLFENFPYTNFHEINLDWILQELKKLVDEWDSFGGTVSATAHESSDPEVSVSGDLKDGLSFDFGLVRGPRGLTGPEGPEGPKGPAGSGLQILDEYATLSDLQTAHPTGSPGDMYLVGTGGSFTLYIWSDDQNDWVDGGALSSPAPYTSTPAMDGTGSAGSSLDFARGDHVHPSDTNKLDVSASDGIYAVESGAQVMLAYSDIPLADAVMQYDSVGDTSIRNLTTSGSIYASNNISTTGSVSASGNMSATDITASGVLSGDTISITSNSILNSDALDTMASSGASYRPMAKIVGTEALQLEYDASNIPNIKLDVLNYNDDGTVTIDEPKVYFTSAFNIDSVNYGETRIDLRPATSLQIGGVKEGTGVTIAADGTISASSTAFSFDLLWSNASPSSNFGNQTVLVDLTGYSLLFITSEKATTMILNSVGEKAQICYGTSSNVRYRDVEIASNGVTFASGYGGASVDNSNCRPFAIYGIK